MTPVTSLSTAASGASSISGIVSMISSKRLNPEMFARIHKSFIVNLEYVGKLSGSELSLNDGTTLGITANFQSEFNTKYRNFVIRQMEK